VDATGLTDGNNFCLLYLFFIYILKQFTAQMMSVRWPLTSLRSNSIRRCWGVFVIVAASVNNTHLLTYSYTSVSLQHVGICKTAKHSRNC